MTTSDDWGSDVRISQPQPADPDIPVVVDLGGFGFTPNGLVHNITSTEVEEVFSPTFAPPMRGQA
jgi:hypothetical protein